MSIHSLVENLLSSVNSVGMTLSAGEYTKDFIDGGYCLEEIPDFQGLLPKSYQAGVPVFDLLDDELDATGPILHGMIERRDNFRNKFQSLNSKLINLLDRI
jgi:chromosome partitioning protein